MKISQNWTQFFIQKRIYFLKLKNILIKIGFEIKEIYKVLYFQKKSIILGKLLFIKNCSKDNRIYYILLPHKKSIIQILVKTSIQPLLKLGSFILIINNRKNHFLKPKYFLVKKKYIYSTGKCFHLSLIGFFQNQYIFFFRNLKHFLFKNFLQKIDYIFELFVLNNLKHLSSHYALAKEISSYLNSTLYIPQYKEIYCLYKKKNILVKKNLIISKYIFYFNCFKFFNIKKWMIEKIENLDLFYTKNSFHNIIIFLKHHLGINIEICHKKSHKLFTKDIEYQKIKLNDLCLKKEIENKRLKMIGIHILLCCLSIKHSFLLVINDKILKKRRKFFNLDINFINQLLGAKLNYFLLIKFLELKGYKIKRYFRILKIFIPSYISSYIHSNEDLLTEFLKILYNDLFNIQYSDHISLKNPISHSLTSIFLKQAAFYLINNDFNEVYNFSLCSIENIKCFIENNKLKFFKIKNPINSLQTHLRFSLLPDLIKCFEYNKKYHISFKKFFEIGSIFQLSNNVLYEYISIGGIMHFQSNNNNYYQIKSYIISLLSMLHLSISEQDWQYLKEKNFWQPNCSFKLSKIKEKGFEIKIGLINHNNIMNLYAFELILNKDIIDNIKSLDNKTYNKYQLLDNIAKDISIIFDQKYLCEHIKKTMEYLLKHSSEEDVIILSIAIFDYFTGMTIPSNKKSVSLTILYQMPEEIHMSFFHNKILKSFNYLIQNIIKYTDYLIR